MQDSKDSATSETGAVFVHGNGAGDAGNGAKENSKQEYKLKKSVKTYSNLLL